MALRLHSQTVRNEVSSHKTDFVAELVDFASMWSCIRKNLRLLPAHHACLYIIRIFWPQRSLTLYIFFWFCATLSRIWNNISVFESLTEVVLMSPAHQALWTLCPELLILLHDLVGILTNLDFKSFHHGLFSLPNLSKNLVSHPNILLVYNYLSTFPITLGPLFLLILLPAMVTLGSCNSWNLDWW